MPAHDPTPERAAVDPRTPPQVLWKLAYQYPELRPRIAENPAVPQELRAKILGTPNRPANPSPAPSPAAANADLVETRPLSSVPPVSSKPLYRDEAPRSAPPPLMAVPREAQPEERRDRGSMVMVLGLTVVAVVALIGVVLLFVTGGSSPQGITTVAASQPDSAEPSAANSAMASEEANSGGLEALGAKGCKAASSDADLVVSFGAENSTNSAWKDPSAEQRLIDELARLEKACGSEYVTQVARTAENSGATPALIATLTAQIAPEPVRPAPAGALAHDLVVSPSGNIVCHLEQDRVVCNIQEFDSAAPGVSDCGTSQFSMAVDDAGAVTSCTSGAPSAGQGTRLEYGQSTAVGTFACTSESTGMTCWNTTTGRGFTMSRESFTQF